MNDPITDNTTTEKSVKIILSQDGNRINLQYSNVSKVEILGMLRIVDDILIKEGVTPSSDTDCVSVHHEKPATQPERETIEQFIKNRICSKRLKTSLIEYICRFPYRTYIQEITTRDLLKVRNCGANTVKEFVELRGYIHTNE